MYDLSEMKRGNLSGSLCGTSFEMNFVKFQWNNENLYLISLSLTIANNGCTSISKIAKTNKQQQQHDIAKTAITGKNWNDTTNNFMTHQLNVWRLFAIFITHDLACEYSRLSSLSDPSGVQRWEAAVSADYYTAKFNFKRLKGCYHGDLAVFFVNTAQSFDKEPFSSMKLLLEGFLCGRISYKIISF